MTNEEIRTTLEEQLKLLAQVSKDETQRMYVSLPALTESMLSISGFLLLNS